MKNVTLLKNLSFLEDGIQVFENSTINDNEFQKQVEEVYSKFKPAVNAINPLHRAIRWGIKVKNQTIWLENNQYQVSANLNPEEKGAIRTMQLIPNDFLETPQVRAIINQTFEAFYPSSSTADRAYMVQLSSIRYQPTLEKTCEPSPNHPHQDGYDSAIWVLQKTPGLIGGYTRIFTANDGSPLYQLELKPGEGLLVSDKNYQHQVLPMLFDPHSARDIAVRDILIVRIDPVSR